MKKITRLILLIVAIAAWGNVANATNTECSGTATDASQGSFTLGYNYSFTTSGTDVIVTFELLDNPVGLVAFAWTYNPNFAEIQMTNTSGNIFTETFSGQTIGSTFNVACKFAFAGGMSVTKTFAYTVGNACGGVVDTTPPTGFTATLGAVTANTAELLLNGTDDSGAVTYGITYGTTTLSTSSNSGVQESYIVKGLTPSTGYSFSVTAKDATGNVATNSPIVVPATTTALPVPTVSAPTPPVYSPAKVISIFSDAYTNVAGTNYNPNWGQSTAVSTIQIGSDNVLEYSNLNYQGTVFGSDVNASTMKYLHIDVWTANETSLQIFPIMKGDAFEKFYQLTPLNLNAWNSYDIPLTVFTSQNLDLSDLIQFKIVGAGGNTVYLDNIYFYDDSATVDTTPPTGFTATLGAVTANTAELLLNGTDDSGVVTYGITYGTTTLSTSSNSGVQESYIVTGLTPLTGYSFSVTAKDATGNVATNSPIVVPATTTALTVPTVSAPTPTHPANQVASLFSDAYQSADPGTNFFPGWSQSTIVSTIKIDSTDNVLKYANFNYEGTQIIHNLIVPDMKYLHVDVFTPDLTTFKIGPISPGPVETDFVATPTANQWNSYDIPVSTFSGVNMSDIFQMGTSGGNGTQTVYLDNIYFWTDAAADTQAPTAFTAAAGTIASDAVTLLLNATDDSGVVFFDITYGTTTVTASGISGAQTPFIISGLTGSTAYSFSIVARDRTGNLAANNPIVVTATTLSAYPAAPVPTYDASKVISVYSDNYTSVMGPNGWEDWYGNTFSTVSLGGNSTLKDIATCCLGVSFATPTIDVSSMTYLHVDIYPVTTTTMKCGVVDNNGKQPLQVLTLTSGQWNPINISLAGLKDSLAGTDLTMVKQVAFQGVAGTFYLDNLLFYNDGTTGISSVISENGISCYPNPITNKLTVSAKTEISQLTVRNLLGQSVKTATVNGFEKVIDLSDVASGNYILTLKLANGQLSTQKIIKL